MKLFKEKQPIKPLHIVFIALTVLFIVLVVMFMQNSRTFGNQAISALYPSADFNGQVKIAEGPWEPYEDGKHIPINKGDVTLKGSFELLDPITGESLGKPPIGASIAFYLNHINCQIIEDNGATGSFDTELPVAGDEMCGIMYTGYKYMGGDEVTITLKNPHRFGNERAVDQFLDNLSIYGGTAFEGDMTDRGNGQRVLGFILILFAFMLIGTALFSFLIRLKNSMIMLFIGTTVLFSGIHFIFSAHGVMFFSEIIKFNTRILGLSQMLYMLSATTFVVCILKQKLKRIGKVLLYTLIAADTAFLALTFLSDVCFFDLWGLWVVVQTACSAVITVLLIHAFCSSDRSEELLYAFSMPPMISFIIDSFGTYFGWWESGMFSGYVFIIIFVVALFMLLRVIPKNISNAMKATELEAEKNMLKAELAESRIAIMISQIQPHFIYNTLGTIEHLCITKPEAASKLVRDFTLYLRGNFSELDNAKPIRFSQEMNHVKHYTDIEQVRFPDMTIKYDLRSVEFVLPALSVQPLVENAIKHGLMGLEKGGCVTICAYETDTHYIVEVEDNGVGFDASAEYDEKKHVGIKNIRGRIEAMCNGTLTVESTPGTGTKATLKIPKEVSADDSNNS